MNKFGENLRKFREEKGLSQRKLGAQLGYKGDNAVVKVEKNQVPTYKFLESLNKQYPEIDLLEMLGFKVEIGVSEDEIQDGSSNSGI